MSNSSSKDLLILYRVWSKISTVAQDEGEYSPLQESRGKASELIFTKKKSRHIKPSFVLLLFCCVAVTTFVVRHGIPSLPLYDSTMGQALLVHFLVGWERPNAEHNGNYSGRVDERLSQHDAGEHHRTFAVVSLSSSTDEASRKEKEFSFASENFPNELHGNKSRYRKSKSGTEEIKNGHSSTNTQSTFSVSRGMLWNKVRGSSKEDHFSCDRTHWRTDVCHLRGDVRIRNKLIALRSKVQQKRVDEIEKIRPYPRKWESPLMNRIEEVTVKRVYESFPSVNSTEKDCDVNYSAPALVFSTGGYTGHIYHDFNDGLIPLFITIQHLKGEVVFLILEFHDWWMNKYSKIVEQLSHYPVIDLRNDDRTHCFPEMIVGLKIHDDLTVNNTLMPSGESIQDFRRILGKIFDSNNELQPLSEPLDKSIVQKVNGSVVHVKAPKLVLIARKESRAILNQDEVVSLAEQLGFEVQVLVPNGQTELGHIYRVLGSCDAMMGVHGAAMTHFLFMRPGSVFIQVVPIGTTWPSSAFYGEPALRFGLQYIEYKIRPEESSLSKIYNNSDPVLTNPEIIVSKGWKALKETYLQNQNVTLSIPRLKKVLLTSLAKIKGV